MSWYLEGARTHVSLAGPPVLAVRAETHGDVLFVAANEADRLIAEELLPEDAERVVRVPWWIPPSVAAAERSGVPESQVAAELRAARARMLPAETERYRVLGRETAETLTDVLGRVGSDQTERAVAAVVAAEFIARGIDRSSCSSPALIAVRSGIRFRPRACSEIGPWSWCAVAVTG